MRHDAKWVNRRRGDVYMTASHRMWYHRVIDSVRRLLSR